MAKAQDRGTVMQFEFDRDRVREMKRTVSFGTGTVSVNEGVHLVIRGALQDVLDHGGTLVVVADTKKVTVVQRPEAEELGEA